MLGYLIRTWLKPFLLILSLTVAVYAIGHLMDLALVDGDGAHNTVYQWVLPSTAANARGDSLPQRSTDETATAYAALGLISPAVERTR